MTSDVQKLLYQINQEYMAGRQALYGLSSGTSQHRLIASKMERMGQLFNKLREQIGEEAMSVLAEYLDNNEDKVPRTLAEIGSYHGIGPHTIATACDLPYERIIDGWRNRPLFQAEARKLLSAINTLVSASYTLEELSWISASEEETLILPKLSPEAQQQ